MALQSIKPEKGVERISSLKKFDLDTKVVEETQKIFSGKVSSNWNIGGNPNGGYLISIVTNALKETVTHPDPFSLTAHFMRSGIADEVCDVEVEVLKAGRSTETVVSTLSQRGEDRIRVTAAYGDLDQSLGIEQQIAQGPPEIPDPGNCVPRTGELQGIELSLSETVDVRLHPEFFSSDSSACAESSGWVRFADGRSPDVRALILFCDVFPPSPFKKYGVLGWVPTVEMTIHLIKKPAPGWILGRFRTESLSNGRMIESGSLWDSSGQQVAESRQLGLIMKMNR